MDMNNNFGNFLINPTLDSRTNQYKNDNEATVTANLTNRGNFETSPGGYNPANGQGQFRFWCKYSHFNYDDPIVYPGQPGKAHLHMYWGNTLANGNTTDNSLVNTGGGSCAGYEANRTAYWMPAVLDGNNKAVIPKNILMYYKTEGTPSLTKTMPAGLKMIAGNANGNTDPSLMNENGIQWQCYTGVTTYTYEGQTIPDTCPPNPNTSGDTYPINLVAIIYFPACVAVSAGGQPILDTSEDLARFPSNNHKDHVKYFTSNSGNPCPASHPYIMPRVSYHIEFPGNLNYSGWHLSSDRMSGKPIQPDGTTLHADWYGGWNSQVMEHWTRGCIQKGQNCSNGVLGFADGYPSRQLKTFTTDYTGPNNLTVPGG